MNNSILEFNEASAASQSMLAKLQESTGFAKDVLARVEEDVWNGHPWKIE